jgi:hypothetical protein
MWNIKVFAGYLCMLADGGGEGMGAVHQVGYAGFPQEVGQTLYTAKPAYSVGHG